MVRVKTVGPTHLKVAVTNSNGMSIQNYKIKKRFSMERNTYSKCTEYGPK